MAPPCYLSPSGASRSLEAAGSRGSLLPLPAGRPWCQPDGGRLAPQSPSWSPLCASFNSWGCCVLQFGDKGADLNPLKGILIPQPLPQSQPRPPGCPPHPASPAPRKRPCSHAGFTKPLPLLLCIFIKLFEMHLPVHLPPPRFPISNVVILVSKTHHLDVTSLCLTVDAKRIFKCDDGLGVPPRKSCQHSDFGNEPVSRAAASPVNVAPCREAGRQGRIWFGFNAFHAHSCCPK